MFRSTFVFRIGQLGDTLVALPAIWMIRERYTGDRMILITNRPAKVEHLTAWDVLGGAGMFEAVLFYDRWDIWSLLRIVRCARAAGTSARLIYLSPLRSRRQLCRDHFFFRMLCGFRDIVGLEAGNGMDLGMNREGEHATRRSLRESDRLIELVLKGDDTSGEELRPTAPLLVPSPREDARADELLGDIPEGHVPVALGHGSKMPAKRWPLDRFRELACRLLEDGKVHLVLLGGREDAGSGEILREGMEARITNLAGKTTVMESAALLQRCKLFVGNDTGAMHLAAAMGVPVVGIFSARDIPGKWEPFGEGHTILRKKVECAGCMKETCDEQQLQCLTRISVQEVQQAVLQSLTRNMPRLRKFDPKNILR